MNVRLKGTGVLDFNTSYVTVQQKSSLVILIFKIISIHPMLRFNGCYKCYYDFISEFQYILCYGSTKESGHYDSRVNISIHPMLRFNALTELDGYIGGDISIHPMLRFN